MFQRADKVRDRKDILDRLEIINGCLGYDWRSRSNRFGFFTRFASFRGGNNNRVICILSD
ncbi:hypothetical protein ACIOWE_14700 [Pseudomonas sp. NPDC087598]|uniref:hypothetical protein n=1 Tax=Pseudomonas sp. NPDC087598 TaxID=3364440 RepID=UPI0038126996